MIHVSAFESVVSVDEVVEFKNVSNFERSILLRTVSYSTNVISSSYHCSSKTVVAALSWFLPGSKYSRWSVIPPSLEQKGNPEVWLFFS